MLNRFSRGKLRWFFSLFFLALVIPSSILSWKAYEQLRWESLIQYQQEAASLTKQIDNLLGQAIEKEEARADADYSFYKLSGDPKLGYVQPSELSKFPVESEIPGVVGYFQVDAEGIFSTPLLPSDSNQSQMYGIADEERVLRKQLEHQIRAVLYQNQLVSDPRREVPELTARLADKTTTDSDSIATDELEAEAVASLVEEETANNFENATRDEASAARGISESDANQRQIPPAATSADSTHFHDPTLALATAEQSSSAASTPTETEDKFQQSSSALGAVSNLVEEKQEAAPEKKVTITGSRIKRDNKSKTIPSKYSSQQAFTKLQTPEEQLKISEDLTSNQKLSKLKSNRQQIEQRQKAQADLDKRSRKNRMEQNYIAQQQSRAKEIVAKTLDSVPVPESVSAQPSADEIVLDVERITEELADNEEIQISLFSSKVEPFRFSLLRSGHFVAYRQVWREQRRLIQGAIIDAEKFFELGIMQFWNNSGLSDISSLNIGYANSLLKVFSGDEEYYSRAVKQAPLKGEQLYFGNLSEPFNQMSMLFTITKMPVSAGANFILIVAISLVVVITVGTYLLYRLALGQSLLAQQQQDFVSSVSHELKTPLTSIRMYGEILKQGWMDEAKKQEYYDYIYNESERLSRLIANVLQISKVNRNALELDLKSTSVAQLIDLVHSKIDRQIEQSGFEIDFKVDLNVADLKLNVEQDAFIQVIINLVDNAIKYSARSETKKIIFGVSNTNEQVFFSVRDFGPGIAKSQRKKIFDLFYRTGSELTRECQGTGIGLALVRELVSAMNASIEVTNQKPGAEFVVAFPLNR